MAALQSAAPGVKRPAADDLHRRIVESIDDGLYYVNRDRRIELWSQGAERTSGYPASQIVGRFCFANILNHVDDTGQSLCQGRCPLAATIEDGQRRQASIYLCHRDGHRVPVRVRVAPVRDKSGRIVGATEVFTDESPAHELGADVGELRRLAFVDELTGLPNRHLAERTLAGRLDSLARHGWPFGILVGDVDQFKRINDDHGHLAGDRALRVLARTVANATRPEDFVGRWGGDEFVVLVAGADPAGLLTSAQRVRALVARSRLVDAGCDVPVSISIGATVARARDTVEELFGRADRALYLAKEAGRNQVRLGDDGPPPATPGG